MRSRHLWLLLLAATVLLLPGCAKVQDGSNAIVVGGDDDGFNGALLTEAYAVPGLALTDTDGARYSLAKDADSPLTLVFFGYTRCPDICQIVMWTIASSLQRLDPAERDQVDVVFVTTDPARDDAATLRHYLDQFDPEFTGLTGDPATIRAVGKKLGVYIARGQELPDGGYEVDHSTPVVGLHPDGTAPIVWTQGTSSAELAEDISHLLGRGATS
jgi:protein SCO1/2